MSAGHIQNKMNVRSKHKVPNYNNDLGHLQSASDWAGVSHDRGKQHSRSQIEKNFMDHNRINPRSEAAKILIKNQKAQHEAVVKR